jgi:hypothetical protein
VQFQSTVSIQDEKMLDYCESVPQHFQQENTVVEQLNAGD